jgi:hypothetical protein
MGKPTFKSNPRVRAVFDDLEQYLKFCRNYGYRYHESDLYNWKSYAYQQFNKFLQGKHAKDMWLQNSRYNNYSPNRGR